MTRVGDITGQWRLIDEIERAIRPRERTLVRLRGPSGSGKTWVARAIAQRWRDRGGVAFLAPGDELFTRRAHFPLLFAVSSETGRAKSQASTKLAVEPLSAIPLGGRPLRDVLLQLFERKDAEAVAKTPYLRQDDREILMRIQKASEGRRVLLICDNLHWWDDVSLELLRLALTPQTRAAFPFLAEVALLVVETTESGTQESVAFRSLFDTPSWSSFDLPLSTVAVFGALLQAFGVRHALPGELVDKLFAVTGGHLELVRRIAELEARPAAAVRGDAVSARSELLSDLLEQRLERHTHIPEETASVLRAASIIGTSFAEHELDCLVHGDPTELGRILEPAEKLKILERSGHIRTFVHEVVRLYYLQHAKTRREELHLRFAECLRLVHSGDYARRAEHFRRSHNRRRAGELVVLECLRAMRAGHPPILEGFRDELDADLAAFLDLMYSAHVDFDAGLYRRAIDRLAGIEDLYADALLAERDIVQARCHIKLLSRQDREEAKAILFRCERVKDSEPEVWARAMLYLTVACVFLGDEVEARGVERALYEALARRVTFDPTARRTVNHIRLKSNMLHSVQVARQRLHKAIEFFGGAGDIATYDPLHQCIGLVNLAANHIVEGEFAEAFVVALQASDLLQTEQSMTFGRADILATNLTLAGYLCDRIRINEALEVSRSIWESCRHNNDGPLLASNVAYYLAHGNRYADAIDILEPLFRELLHRAEADSYYTYYVGNNLSGCFWALGQKDRSADVWTAITPYLRNFIGPLAPYLKRRHELQYQIFAESAKNPDWDRFLSFSTPAQVGPGWKFYGRGFLAAELEFWSDE